MENPSPQRAKFFLSLVEIVVLVALFAMICVAMFVWHMSKEPFIYVDLFLLVLYVIGAFINHDQGKRMIKEAGSVVTVPLVIVHLYAALNQGLSLVLLAFFSIASITFVLALWIGQHVLYFPATKASLLFVTLTATSILMSFFGNRVIRVMEGVFAFIQGESKSYALYIAPQNRIRIGLFMLYFIGIIAVSFAGLNGRALLGIADLDTAVLQSFAALVAFDRIKSNWQSGIESLMKDGQPLDIRAEVRKHIEVIRNELRSGGRDGAG
jgi:hypothetical protein